MTPRILGLAAAAILTLSAVDFATAQQQNHGVARNSSREQVRPRPPAVTPVNPYGLANCAERPFARDCDKRGTW